MSDDLSNISRSALSSSKHHYPIQIITQLLERLQTPILLLCRNLLELLSSASLTYLARTIKLAMSHYESNSFDESSLFTSQGPVTLLDRLSYMKQLVYSRTKLEFRLLWNKIFQKEDDELSWLLNPYNPNAGGSTSSLGEATMMKSFNKNTEAAVGGYQYNFGDVSSTLGREKVTIYSRAVARRPNHHRRSKGRRSDGKGGEKKSLGESAVEIARYMGMGVYMTSTSFPSPFFPINESQFHQGETFYTSSLSQNEYSMSKLW